MILINFAHPLTNDNVVEIETLTNDRMERVVKMKTHFNLDIPFAIQVSELIDQVGFSPVDWQTKPLLINLPSLSYISALLLAELHGRIGYFPPIIRLKPVTDSLTQAFVVTEIINLQKVRDNARLRR